MTLTAAPGVYYDPWDVEIAASPYPLYQRMREETPLYYNEQHDFYALTRYEDVNRALKDDDTFTSTRGVFLEFIKTGIVVPPGTLVFEDPPVHDIHRNLLSRMFTPRKIGALEGQIRDFAVACLDPIVGTGEFDFVLDLGHTLPIRVIGLLLGIPESDQANLMALMNDKMTTEAGKPMELNENSFDWGEIFAEYVDWRIEHPSEDIITELLHANFADANGVERCLTREELLTFINVIAIAGGETTNRLLGWAGKVLAEHPDQRRDLVENPGLIPRAVEELLRYEPPVPHISRCTTRDSEFYGQTVPEGSAMVLLLGSACRDQRQFGPNSDSFDIHREQRQHLALAVGAHYCLGASLARMEGRVCLEEILKRFPEWDLDLDNATLSSTATVRGWDCMPTLIPTA